MRGEVGDRRQTSGVSNTPLRATPRPGPRGTHRSLIRPLTVLTDSHRTTGASHPPYTPGSHSYTVATTQTGVRPSPHPQSPHPQRTKQT